VPLGTDPEQFRPGIDTHAVRARYNVNGGAWVLTVARLEPYKGVDMALRAVAQCRKDGLNLNYLVVGTGKKRKEYRKLAEELNIASHVRFVGNVPEAELPAVFNIANAYVGVSRRADGSRVEGFGVALAEASACGLPVIAGQSGGLAEAVRDGETGLVVNPEDPDAVAAALKRLIGDGASVPVGTPIAIIGLPPAAPHIKDGKMRAVGLSRRSAVFPDVPTFAEMGFPNQDADLVIGAVLIPGAAAPRLVTRQLVSQMKHGAVIVDVAIDQGGCCETSRPTTHADPTYVVDGVVHYCVANMPGAVPRTSTYALNNATLPFVLALAGKGWRAALRADPHLRNGLNICGGKVTQREVAEALGYAFVGPDSVV